MTTATTSLYDDDYSDSDENTRERFTFNLEPVLSGPPPHPPTPPGKWLRDRLTDLSQTSHCNIKGLSVSDAMRIENMITQV